MLVRRSGGLVWVKKGKIVGRYLFPESGNYTPLCIPPKPSAGILKFDGTAVNTRAFRNPQQKCQEAQTS